MNILDIHTTNWQMSLAQPDTIVEGKEDIEQCIDVILKTRKGEDPLRPHFGCGLFDWIDRPVNTSIPAMKKEILEALSHYETRIQVTSLAAKLLGDSNVIFNIGYKTPEGSVEVYDFDISGLQPGNNTTPLVLSATYEEGAYRYYIDLILNGNHVAPNPPTSGFPSITSMMTWLNNFWYIYGTFYWVFGQKKVLLYVPANIAQSGSISIISDTNILLAAFPTLGDGEFYATIFKDENNNRITPFNDTINNTQGSVLSYVQSNYGAYGMWSIDGGNLILDGDIPLNGFTLDIEAVVGTSAFTEGFNIGFQA